MLKKTYKGNVDVRDYKVKECIDKGESMDILFDNQIMTLSPEDLKTKIVSRSKTIESKRGGRNYVLYGYNWEPNEEEF